MIYPSISEELTNQEEEYFHPCYLRCNTLSLFGPGKKPLEQIANNLQISTIHSTILPRTILKVQWHAWRNKTLTSPSDLYTDIMYTTPRILWGWTLRLCDRRRSLYTSLCRGCEPIMVCDSGVKFKAHQWELWMDGVVLTARGDVEPDGNSCLRIQVFFNVC